jgi:putative oxidoreductase
MKKLFLTSINENLAHIWLLFFRIIVSGFMLTHGLPKIMKILEGNFSFSDPFGIGSTTSLFLAAFSEGICSILIMFGLATRLATIPLIATMATAAFIVHANDPFGRKELALMYMVFYITILLLGPGKFSVDNLLLREKRRY